MEEILEQSCVYVDKYGKEHEVFPMLLKDFTKADRLFKKIDDTYLFLNLPVPKTNSDDKIIFDEITKDPILDTSKYSAMMQLFELALHEPQEEIEKWIDLKNGSHIFDEYRQISGLKKAVAQEIINRTLQSSLQQ